MTDSSSTGASVQKVFVYPRRRNRLNSNGRISAKRARVVLTKRLLLTLQNETVPEASSILVIALPPSVAISNCKLKSTWTERIWLQGIGTTAFKRACRQLGILRWPPRPELKASQPVNYEIPQRTIEVNTCSISRYETPRVSVSSDPFGSLCELFMEQYGPSSVSQPWHGIDCHCTPESPSADRASLCTVLQIEKLHA